MDPIDESGLRRAFVNCTKGEASRLPLPRDLDRRPWADLDFLGWRDLGAPDRAYLVTEHGGRTAGVVLRASATKRGFLHRSACSICLTTHPGAGVALMAARKTGPAGRQGDSVGLYICADLDCSLYARGLKKVGAGGSMDEFATAQEKVDRLRTALGTFLDRVTAR
ncbi:FBP domain-containing protein [Nocardiopsis coralliicola]